MKDILKRLEEINKAIIELEKEKRNLLGLLEPKNKHESITEKSLIEFLKLKDIDFLREDDVFLLTDDFGVRIADVTKSTEGVNSNIRKKFEDDNIEIVTIFPWHDANKMFDFISYKINLLPTKRVFARKCEVVVEDINKEVRDFIRKNHILDYSRITKKIGAVSLFYEGERIATSIFTKYGNKDNIAELKRQVFKRGYSVVGGASKMLSHFKENFNNIDTLITFSDLDLSGLDVVYSKIGFELIEINDSVFTWYNPRLDKKFSNVSLIMVGADRLLKDDPGYVPYGIGENLPSNQEIVEKHGYIKVYDTGYSKWSIKLESEEI